MSVKSSTLQLYFQEHSRKSGKVGSIMWGGIPHTVYFWPGSNHNFLLRREKVARAGDKNHTISKQAGMSILCLTPAHYRGSANSPYDTISTGDLPGISGLEGNLLSKTKKVKHKKQAKSSGRGSKKKKVLRNSITVRKELPSLAALQFVTAKSSKPESRSSNIYVCPYNYFPFQCDRQLVGATEFSFQTNPI